MTLRNSRAFAYLLSLLVVGATLLHCTAPGGSARGADRSPAGEAAGGGGEIQFAMQFETERGVTGSVESYTAFRPELPLPEYVMIYGNVLRWHAEPERQREILGRLAQRASRAGVRKVLFTPTARYEVASVPDARLDELARRAPEKAALARELKETLSRSDRPPLDELVRREWRDGRPGLLGAMREQRDALAALVDAGIVDAVVLRPFQEAGSGMHSEVGLTPQRYRELIGWMANDLYRGIPIDAVIVHWNAIEGLAEAIPRLADRSVEVYAGVTISMPSVAGMSSIELLEEDPERALEVIRRRRPELAEVARQQGVDFASRAWRQAGVKTWIAELSVFDDGRVDPITGWRATGLTDPSVIPNFFHHYRNMRRTGHVGGITWLNRVGFTGTRTHDPDVKDCRWDGDHVHPEVRAWWLDEVTRENGYDL